MRERGTEIIVIDGFKFSFHKKLAINNVSWWKCVKRSCKAFLKKDEYDDILEAELQHAHYKCQESHLLRQQISNTLKGRPNETFYVKPAKLIRT